MAYARNVLRLINLHPLILICFDLKFISRLLTGLFYPKRSNFIFHWIGENKDNEKNVAFKFQEAPDMVGIRYIGNCLEADPDYCNGVADAIGIPLDKVPKR